MRMPMLFVDLDNTISDRASSFRRWTHTYLTDRFGRADEQLISAMVVADGDGLRHKPEVAADLARLLDLTPAEQAEIIVVLRAGTLDELQPTPGIIESLDAARAAGFEPFIVTNGRPSQQEGKIAKLGLADHVAGMVVSEAVGVAKPDPEIFRIAARQAGGSLDDGWMVGDSAEADIRGAVASGLRSVWLRRGREYPTGMPDPTHVADSFVEAVGLVLSDGASAL